MKSNFADLSVRNSGLKTMFKFGYELTKSCVVPGITVDLTSTIGNFPLSTTLEISAKQLFKIVKSMSPDFDDGVGTHGFANGTVPVTQTSYAFNQHADSITYSDSALPNSLPGVGFSV